MSCVIKTRKGNFSLDRKKGYNFKGIKNFKDCSYKFILKKYLKKNKNTTKLRIIYIVITLKKMKLAIFN